jgi:predicted DCC family thiol-disulfide oxidoreductase YuxK
LCVCVSGATLGHLCCLQVSELKRELESAQAECRLLVPLQEVNASLTRAAEEATERAAELQIQLDQQQLTKASAAAVVGEGKVGAG